MGSIAVQTAVGSLTGKAVTELSYSFGTLVNTGRFQYGLNNEGIFLLNIGEQDNDVDYTRSFTLASSDLDAKNLKRFRFLFIGVDTDDSFTISVMGDNKTWRDYDVVLNKTGLQEIQQVVGHGDFGRYWKIKISSTSRFRVDSIDGTLIVRPLGVRG